ncbi:hydrogenase formation protein HypD [Candidatus Woesearchaeota archaeon]|nr:MAG: hydrogenase formation protein HypD [Candidatus Woesearchaeota archaeon]
MARDAQEIIRRIREIASSLGTVRIMEVCGGHTNTIMRYGIRDVLPDNVKLISGPGCPVCVTSQRDVDSVVELALNGVKIATYGDMMHVPGTTMSLAKAHEKGADIQVVYSVDELKEKDRVFFGVGFETTTPMTAKLLSQGFTVFSAHKLMEPAMRAVMKDMRIDGFIDPGHVSTIIGTRMWKTLDVAQVISGFEAEHVLSSIEILLEMISLGKKGVVNNYPEVVRDEGNTQAWGLVEKTMKVCDAEWRGFGVIPKSGLVPRDEMLDARIKFREIIEGVKTRETPGCRCPDVIKGVIEPKECPLFGKACTPSNPRGACMVSETEGACAIAFKYGKSLSEDR